MKISKTTFVISIILLTAFSQSCSFDQVESKYDDYVSVKQDGLFDKGWIPTTITYESMTNIYQKTNIDINTCIFSFNLSQTDIAKLSDKILLTQIPYPATARILSRGANEVTGQHKRPFWFPTD